MKATLIFDSVNDLLFSKWDESFLQRMKSFNEQDNEGITDSHHVSQLLSPIITSQRVMAAQFGNTYSSMQCKDKTTIVFDEWLDHVFLIISEDSVDEAHRELLDCKTFVQHICGQNINLLQSPVYQDWLSVLLESRTKGDSIPGASGVIGESGASGAALNALKAAAKDIKTSPYQHYHLMLIVGDKILALYSSRGSEDLTPPDLILLSIQCIAAQEYWKDAENTTSGDGINTIVRLPWLSQENSAIVYTCAGAAASPCAPHALHVAALAPRISFLMLIDMEMRDVGISTHMSSQILSNLRRLLLQRNLEMLPGTLDALEASLKKTTDALRKNKANAQLCARISSRMLELRKSCATTAPLTPETAASAAHSALDAVLHLLRPHIPSVRLAQPLADLRTSMAPYVDFLRVKAARYFSLGSVRLAQPLADLRTSMAPYVDFLRVKAARYFSLGSVRLAQPLADVRTSMAPYVDFLRVKASRYFSLGSGETDVSSLTLHKYVEEFPGLIHFIYVDRTAGRFLAPDMADCVDMLSPETVKAVVSRALCVAREGYSAATWRRGALHACCVWWWERRGAAVTPARAPHPAAVRALPPPGDVRGAFYRQLAELAFPADSQGVSLRELVCVHVGLLPAATAVQQARRLAHSVYELASDHPAAAADLL